MILGLELEIAEKDMIDAFGGMMRADGSEDEMEM